MRSWWSSVPTASNREPRRITLLQGGPALVEGPVELMADDGTVVVSDRFLVAVCTCRRSKSFPLCDTSHRKRVRPGSDQD